MKSPVNTGLTGLKSGVGDNDHFYDFSVFKGIPGDLVFRGHRIGHELTNFNVWDVFGMRKSIKILRILFFDLRIVFQKN